MTNLDHSTAIELERPAQRSHLRARLAKLRKAAAAMLRREPARPSSPAVANQRLSDYREPAMPSFATPASVGMRLDARSILEAYRRGFLLEHDPKRIAWLSPARREAIAPQELRIGSPLRRLLRDRIFTVSFDQDFAGVVGACEATAPAEERLTPDLIQALLTLHRAGHAHSVEVLSPDGALAGGLYGIAIGGVFFAEGKFEHARKVSALALAVLHHHLDHWGFVLRSARWSLPRGVHMVGREIFQRLLDTHTTRERRLGHWAIDPALDTYAWSLRPRVACRRPRNGSLPPLSASETGIAGRSEANGAAHPPELGAAGGA
jgi:leucyl/phenylalanyl-tRNA--protein transferase